MCGPRRHGDTGRPNKVPLFKESTVVVLYCIVVKGGKTKENDDDDDQLRSCDGNQKAWRDGRDPGRVRTA